MYMVKHNICHPWYAEVMISLSTIQKFDLRLCQTQVLNHTDGQLYYNVRMNSWMWTWCISSLDYKQASEIGGIITLYDIPVMTQSLVYYEQIPKVWVCNPVTQNTDMILILQQVSNMLLEMGW